jgi:glucose-1-phosphate cytidylyltransferase
MKTVILCGGRGSRLREHGTSIPKALIEIGGRPILWHLLKLYVHHGFADFILCLGYLGHDIKRYFLEQHWLNADFTLRLATSGDFHLHRQHSDDDDWELTFAETGLDTNTGGRVKRIASYLGDDEDFFVTYGDGLADLDIEDLLRFHRAHGRLATLTVVHPHSNFGILKLDDQDVVTEFHEKPLLPDWVNGGFFVFQRQVLDYLHEDSVLEREPLSRLANEGQLMAYRHTGFWKCMDTYKDNLEFNQLFEGGNAPWMVWAKGGGPR